MWLFLEDRKDITPGKVHLEKENMNSEKNQRNDDAMMVNISCDIK